MNYDNLLYPRVILLPIFSIFLITFLLVSSQSVYADTIFVDTFDKDPQANGWTENFVVDVLDGINLLLPPHTGHGSEVIMEKNHFQPRPTGAESRSFSINQIISTVGFENIQISLTAHQSSDNYEPADFLEISVDTNGDGIFESVLKDVEIWEGVEDQSTMDTDVPNGNTIPTSTGFIPLSNTADNNPNLNIKIEASFNSYREDYFLTEVEVIGDAIQGNCGEVPVEVVEEPVEVVEEPVEAVVDNSSLTLYAQTQNLYDELESIFSDSIDIQKVEKLDSPNKIDPLD
ncbi:hypothetical protein IH785_11915 [candidate division KSB1 bacterium]|nr:hypothetical protein [candidate division KSB1 bacterium]